MSKYDGYYDEVDLEEKEEEKEGDSSFSIISLLSLISTWFIRIGMIVAGILVLYYLFTGKFLYLILYATGLLVAFLFGYFFMFFLDKFVTND